MLPPYKQFFRDDWLNDYYDVKSGAASGTAAGSTSVHILHQLAAARCAQRRCSDGAVPAAGEASKDAAAPAHLPAAEAADAAGDVAAAPASCIATSDYRFVYLGPKVPLSVLSVLHLADPPLGHTSRPIWCFISVASCTPTSFPNCCLCSRAAGRRCTLMWCAHPRGR